MKQLNAGPVKVAYENGFLRRMTYGETEILRMIYFALRDHNWNTLSHVIENENFVLDDDSFLVEYECLHVDGGLTIMEWKVRIRGKSDGAITFEIAGVMKHAAFKKNRAGFCVLHPLTVAGQECRITHSDGSASSSLFPAVITPDNPFKNVRAMTWTAGSNRFCLEFEGDIFETEDQRNWCDASYKTFCTPLDQPFPVEMRRGQRVSQRITFRAVDALQMPASASGYVTLKDSGLRRVLPFLGIAASTELTDLEEKHLSLLRALRMSHYRIELWPGARDFAVQFSKGYETAYLLGLPLEVALHLSENFLEEMDAFIFLCRQNRVRVSKVLLLSENRLVTGQDIIDQAQALKQQLPRVSIGAGTNYNFTELNKNRFSPGVVDYVSFSVDPQEHAFDDLTILENIGTLEHLVYSAKSIYGSGMAVHVSPVTLRKRFNPYATDPADLHISEVRKADPRQQEPLGAQWTFGSVWGLTRGNASAITFYQAAGNQGVISAGAEPFPLYEVLRNFGAFQGKPATVLESSDPLSINAMVLDGKIVAMQNLAPETKTVRWNNREFELRGGEIQFLPLYSAQHP